VKYAFIQAHRAVFSIRSLCRVLRVHHNGFYAWLKSPLSERGKGDLRLTGLIKQSWIESGCVYGYRKIHDDLRSLGESCCPNRVARLARHSKVKAQVGYKKKPGSYGGKPAVVATNQLKQSFGTLAPNQVWLTDIT
jgi:putative transposase